MKITPDLTRRLQKPEDVAYIVYFRRIPHEVISVNAEFRMNTWNIDPYGGDKTDLMFYNSGGGGSLETIEINAVEGSNCQLWIDPRFRQQVKLNLKNVEIIDSPIRQNSGFRTSINPFKIGDEVGDITYCEKCELHYNDDGCPKHGFDYIEGYEDMRDSDDDEE